MDTRSSLLGRGPFVTDGGLETDLIYHRGMDLPAFAAFPLVEEEPGRAALRGYYDEYAEIARRAGVGLVLESPTWRANPDWGTSLGYDADDLDRVNRDSIELLRELRDEYAVPNTLISGAIGPRGDGYVAGEAMEPDEAARYHSAQVASFAAAGADVASAYTLTGPEEAIGVVRAAREVGLPVAISFTVETDGRLPDGTPLGAGHRTGRRRRRRARLVPRELRPSPAHRARPDPGRPVARPDRRAAPERLHAHPRGAGRGGGAGRGRPRGAGRVVRPAATAAALVDHRGRLLRDGRAARGRPLGPARAGLGADGAAQGAAQGAGPSWPGPLWMPLRHPRSRVSGTASR